MQIELSATFNITASNPTNTKLIRIFWMVQILDTI
jgi:hypothetical protein